MTTEPRDAAFEGTIVAVIGRWARLSDGTQVTPVPPFHTFGMARVKEFEQRVAAFQHDPVGELERRGVAERLPHAKR